MVSTCGCGETLMALWRCASMATRNCIGDAAAGSRSDVAGSEDYA